MYEFYYFYLVYGEPDRSEFLQPAIALGGTACMRRASAFRRVYNEEMRNKWFAFCLALLVSAAVFSSVQANANALEGGTVYDPPLCQPGLYSDQPAGCLPLGPSQSVKALSEQGFPYPIRELPAASPDPKLTELPAYLARINSSGEAPIYASLDDAIAGTNVIGTIPAGASRYVTMLSSRESGGRVFVLTESGGWVEAAPFYSWPRWQGLEFSATPNNDFGWTVNPTPSYSGPGFAYPTTARELDKYAVFQVYQTQYADDYEWYEIGPGEWVPSLKARRLHVDTSVPAGVEGDRWINIDLSNQTLAVYEGGELRFAALIATGSGELYTDPGVYQIYEVHQTGFMQGSYARDKSDFYYLESVPWTMYFNGAQAIHGIYWPALLGFKQSHGCVNMFPGDAQWVYNWAKIGDYVYVHDPSGETPLPTPTPEPTATP